MLNKSQSMQKIRKRIDATGEAALSSCRTNHDFMFLDSFIDLN